MMRTSSSKFTRICRPSKNNTSPLRTSFVRYWEFQDIGDSLKWYRVNPHLDLISNEELDAYQSEYPLRVLLNSHDLRDY